jgi:hypothetical protein
VARMGEGRKVYRVLVGKPERKRPVGRPRHSRMESKWTLGILVGGEWIHLAQDRDCLRAVVNAVMNRRILAPRSQLDLFQLLRPKVEAGG